ncbi:ABA4-like family protein [Bosea minatitlanensis]|uniref:ABA4-like family protein n=1 Tax=Bosea minatitlanensis TaxID=128782 RepID=A0ABW0F0A0_9HYPH|nr:ABA4-like family protein [Bosea minatitlanensis]MCT4492193.1 ABA4-like family protein [Bosea minatitlanensis]
MPPSIGNAAFSGANLLAVCGWLLLIAAPRWRASQVLAGLAIPTLLSLGYLVLIAVHWHEARGGFSSLDDVAALFASRPLLLAGWVHYLAFDLLTGAWLLRRAQREGLPHWAMLPVLALTFLFGPVGYLLYRLVATSRDIVAEDRIPRFLARLPAPFRALEWEPRLGAAGIAMALLAIPTALAYAIDPRLFNGDPVWLKPLKFEISIAVYLFSFALLLPLTSEAFQRSRLGRFTVWPVIGLLFFELVYIAWRASRAEASHYNADGPAAIALYSAMGIAAVLFTAASGILAYGLARKDAAPLPPILRRSLILGLGLTAVLGILSGATLSGAGGHTVGTPLPTAAVIPFFGWSLSVGDLRPAHFLALHAMQIVPGFALLASPLRPAVALRAVDAFALAYACLTGAALVAALNARPLLGIG